MKFCFLLALLYLPAGVFSQNQPKRPLTANDYAGWKTIENAKISASGKLVAYEVNPQKGDGRLLIYHQQGKTDTISRGKKPEIGSNDEFVVFTISQPEDSIRRAKIRKVKKEEMPQDSLGILAFKSNTFFRFPKLKSVSLPEANATCIAFTVSVDATKDTARKGAKTKPIEQPGDNLIIFNSKTYDTTIYHNVTEFIWSQKGGALFFIQQMKDSVTTSSFLKKFETENGRVTILFSGEGFLKKAIPDEKGENFAFLHSKDTAENKVFSLYLGGVESGRPAVIAEKSTPGLPIGWSPGENSDIYFSRDASRLYFGTAPAPVRELEDTIPEDEKPKLDIWNWKDLTLQPQQKVELEKEKKRTYLAVYMLGSKKINQLADLNVSDISLIQKGNGEIALGIDDKLYRRARSWTGNSNCDYYLVDIKTGIKRQIAVNKEHVWLSPAGKFIIWYEHKDSSFYARSTLLEDTKIVPLTRMIPVSFYNELDDRPEEPDPYGIAGWSENDRFVFIYDRFDIWKIDPSGDRVPVCVTLAFGRRNMVQLRYVKTDPDEEFIPAGKISLLSAFNQETMSGGFFSSDIHVPKEPSHLIMSKNSFGTPKKAKYSDQIIWTKESSTDFPDLWYGNLSFVNPQRISDANPQQKEFNWLTSELVEWKSFSGEVLKGLLYKPENFNPSLKYPVIVYFYERNSDRLYRHTIPAPSRSSINRTFYCSNGYFVFIPDITYRIGYPGQSAYDAIMSGVYYLSSTRPYIDISRIGLQGQSWGGYQTAYLITRTDLFAAAMAGAPVSNMTSAYGGIRWESGLSRMFQYEHQQSRIGGSLWEKPLSFIENSPLFGVPKIKTPLLILANDNDGAVPWYQGIELFTALRRLDKSAWMLTYNGEPHNLRAESWANRMDLDKRMFQFFNHFLKSEPMPEWMYRGIPAIEKEKNLGY